MSTKTFECNVLVARYIDGVRHEKACRVSVEIDVVGLAEHLGPRAVRSKSGKARFVKGLVVVRDMGAK